MQTVPLSTAPRQTDISARQLRRLGHVPCIVYGNTENTSFQCELNALTKAYTKAGESTLVELNLGEKSVPVLFHAVTFDPMTDAIAHVDFYAVDMNKEVEADVAIHFEGESPAVKEGAVLVTALDAITVSCLPTHLPHNITVDLSSLVEMDSQIIVGDITPPANVTFITDADAVIVIAQEPREEEPEEVAPAPDAAVAADGTAAPADGAAPAAEGTEEEKK